MTTTNIAQEIARELAWRTEGESFAEYTVKHNEQTDQRRWVSVHELVIQDDKSGCYWRVRYERGLTEYQDVQPFEYDQDGVEFTMVKKISVTRCIYVEDTT